MTLGGPWRAVAVTGVGSCGAGSLDAKGTDAIDLLFAFTGREWDKDAGLYNYRARWYDPETGRFISEDPIGFDADDPNLYTYVGNDPVNRTDPSGLRQANPRDDVFRRLGGYGGYTAGSTPRSVPTGLLSIYDVAAPAVCCSTSFVHRGLSDPVLGASGLLGAQPRALFADFEMLPTGETVYFDQAGNQTIVNSVGAIVSNVVRTETISGWHAGDAVRGAVARDADRLQESSSLSSNAAAAYTYAVRSGIVRGFGNVLGGIIDAALPPSEDSTVSYYSNGYRIVRAGSPETGAFANEALALIAGPYRGLVRSPSRASVGLAAETTAGRIAPRRTVDDLVIDSYGNLSRRADIPGQAHHLNQTAAYRDVIPTRQGASIKLEGNILTDAAAPHTRAHRSLETFWNQYRGTDIVPTNLEYTRALQQSQRASGLPEAQVQQAVRAAIRERVNAGLLGGLEVPRVPRPIRNLAQ